MYSFEVGDEDFDSARDGIEVPGLSEKVKLVF